MLLGVHCFRGGHDLCDMYPLCDCDCHPEKKLEAALLLAGPAETERVHDRMIHRRYSREWRRAERGTDPMFKKGKTHQRRCRRCGQPHPGEFVNCDDCLDHLRDQRAQKKLAA